MTTSNNKPEFASGTLLQDIRGIIDQGRREAYASVSAVMMTTFWKIGQRIVEEEQHGNKRAEYGTGLLKEISAALSEEYGAGFNYRNIFYCRQFYLFFPEAEKLHTRVQYLTWSHFRALLRVPDEKARTWYLEEAARESWSVRTLDRNISSQYYQRLLLSQAKEPVVAEMQEKTAEFQADKLTYIKNPVVAEFLGLGNNPSFTESTLEQAILDHIEQFLLELGKGYAFVARQQHIATDAGDFFIDLVFYNYILKCFVLIDLKTSQVTHQDVGQMDMYVRMYDELKRNPGDNPTLGILLCAETSRDIARYSILNGSQQLFASKYLLCLPKEEELRREIETQKELFRLQHPQQEKED